MLFGEGGAAAVEFALVSGALITAILFVLSVGVLLYLSQALDRATDIAARQIMTGAVQKQSLSQTSFRTSVVCPALPAVFNCDNVIVNVQTVTKAAQPSGYYAFVNGTQTALIMPALSNSTAQFSLGNQGDYVYLQIVYPLVFLPNFIINAMGITTTFNGSPAYLSVSTSAFRNEQY